jgi:5,10-methylenetetrahydrofolate reductase
MNISYEMNPPKIIRNGRFDPNSLKQDMDKFCARVTELVNLVSSVHLTDSVLGIPRVSSICAANSVLKAHPGMKLRCSIRARDRNLSAMIQLASEAVMLGVDGLLIVKGDRPETPSVDSNLNPSDVVKVLNEQGFGDKIKLFLSVPKNPDLNKISKKIEARPYGFITQSITSLEHLRKIVDHAKDNKIQVTSTIMLPCAKNRESADAIGLDWSSYENDVHSFIKGARELCGEVLLTSPKSFNDGIDLLRRLKGEGGW